MLDLREFTDNGCSTCAAKAWPKVVARWAPVWDGGPYLLHRLRVEVEEDTEVFLTVHGSASLVKGPENGTDARWRQGLPALFPPGRHGVGLACGDSILVRPPSHVLLEVVSGRVKACQIQVSIPDSWRT